MRLAEQTTARQHEGQIMSGNAPGTEPSTLELLTYSETAKLLRVSDRTVWGLCKRGELAAVRIGQSVRIDRRDLLAFVEAQKAPP
jgi:excisionase family DNA binding protein